RGPGPWSAAPHPGSPLGPVRPRRAGVLRAALALAILRLLGHEPSLDLLRRAGESPELDVAREEKRQAEGSLLGHLGSPEHVGVGGAVYIHRLARREQG